MLRARSPCRILSYGRTSFPSPCQRPCSPARRCEARQDSGAFREHLHLQSRSLCPFRGPQGAARLEMRQEGALPLSGKVKAQRQFNTFCGSDAAAQVRCWQKHTPRTCPVAEKAAVAAHVWRHAGCPCRGQGQGGCTCRGREHKACLACSRPARGTLAPFCGRKHLPVRGSTRLARPGGTAQCHGELAGVACTHTCLATQPEAHGHWRRSSPACGP